MSDAGDNSFGDFLARVRSGDAAAAEELVRRFEPPIRLEIRMRLGDPRLQRVFESGDVCQSVPASFFVRAAAGQFDIAGPGQLAGLLVAMARNKVAFLARHQRAQRRDNGRNEAMAEEWEAPAAGPTPSRIAVGRELLHEFRRRLSDDERALADRRAKGLQWAEIAAELGGTAQARRKQLARALDRVSRELGLDERGDDE
jgi:RNA polymerase sigma-70 factor (ECF subfamily)